jgi:23S rRNA (pseudouridine1915-N3)-methyltransferase
MTSEEWAADVRRERDASRPAYVVAIGGPDGLDPTLHTAAHRVLSFGQMTWPHQLVRVMAGEQLYRAVTILTGHPYHRG